MVASLLFLLGALQAPPPPEAPIVITAHGGIPFVSPMGEPIRARSLNEDTLARWFNQADTDRDQVLTPAEMQADAARFFGHLDTNGDGQIDPDELVHYEWQMAPEIQIGSRFRRTRTPAEVAAEEKRVADEEAGRERRRPSEPDHGLQGAARYALLNMPEPVAAADADLNRAITFAEFKQAALERFALLDKQHFGSLTLPALEAQKPAMPAADRRSRKPKADEPDARVGVPLPPGP